MAVIFNKFIPTSINISHALAHQNIKSTSSKHSFRIQSNSFASSPSFQTFLPPKFLSKTRCSSKDEKSSSDNGYASSEEDSVALGEFCIIEGRDTVQDFALMQLEEIKGNIDSRRNRIFLLMEEVRRLRIQQRIKSKEQNITIEGEEDELHEYPSSIPFLPPLSTRTLQQYYATYFSLILSIIIFGGLLSPALELKLGIGGKSYEDVITGLHLPSQLSQVDPIVASFSGGAVGVISALMVVEINNVKQQETKICKYCHGTGYLACARCSGSGSVVSEKAAAAVANGGLAMASLRCNSCSGAGKVMCPTCLCTGMALATEHDPRIDPFV